MIAEQHQVNKPPVHHLHSPLPFSITQPRSWYSFYSVLTLHWCQGCGWPHSRCHCHRSLPSCIWCHVMRKFWNSVECHNNCMFDTAQRSMYCTVCCPAVVDSVTTQLYVELMASGLMWTIRYCLHAAVMIRVALCFCQSAACQHYCYMWMKRTYQKIWITVT